MGRHVERVSRMGRKSLRRGRVESMEARTQSDPFGGPRGIAMLARFTQWLNEPYDVDDTKSVWAVACRIVVVVILLPVLVLRRKLR
jgi:hypothetical protein